MPEGSSAFSAFAAETILQPPLRAAITAACCRPEPEYVPALIEAARLSEAEVRAAQEDAGALIAALRRRRLPGLVAALLGEYGLASAEGAAFMGLAEALLRIPDAATRDMLIRDKIGGGDWRAHLGQSSSRLVNAASWGLMAAGGLAVSGDWAMPVLRLGVGLAMRRLGRQFVIGEGIGEALARARRLEARGFCYSYDMLGEAALTAAQARRYFAAYAGAIAAIGAASRGRGVRRGAGISVKLSALHPRFARAQRGRVLGELLPCLADLAQRAAAWNIGMTIDAEEADRLDLSLDLLEALCFAPQLAGWEGLGFAVQAYQKRAPYVLDFCIDLARRSNHRLMLRLVKGAYWDAEIKRAQADGLADFPVFTRKIHTDICYLACARKLLEAGEAVYPQFATHNVLTLASVRAMAAQSGGGAYEFQCLHGMGEALYAEVLRRFGGQRCRIYAPVGARESLLPYLARRLLENGANNAFVRGLGDPSVALTTLLRDPVAEAAAMVPPGAPHGAIARPPELFGAERRNSQGFDFADEAALHDLAAALGGAAVEGGEIVAAGEAAISRAFARAVAAKPLPAHLRAEMLRVAADLLEGNRATLIRLLVGEGKKTLPNACGEIREAVDFLRYYGAEIQNWAEDAPGGLGVVVCISPWNFPLAIFLGQMAAAFAAGNRVLAKPAEETPRIAAYAVRLLHQAGIAPDLVQLIQGDGAVGAALVADHRVDGVVFTGSTEVAKRIQLSLARRTSAAGRAIPLIAETAGQNAMIVDSSALPEQVVRDALYSAFDSAGQRCSALRVLCLQEEAAPAILPMLKAAMGELCLGAPDRLATDVGPLISAAAAQNVREYIETMRAAGHSVTRMPGGEGADVVAPTLIEIPELKALGGEVFGPVLHVLTFPRAGLDALVGAINATGYGLTFGLHSRIEATIARVTGRIRAGNIYVNRNMVGAVVGVQPFGGVGLSGTGPKAGGPLYLRRLRRQGGTALPPDRELPGPLGERNLYRLVARGKVLCRAKTLEGRAAQAAAVAAGQSLAVFDPSQDFAAVLLEGEAEEVREMNMALAARPGPVVALHALSSASLAAGQEYDPAWLLAEQVVSINTAAAGGNASLMALG